jgi:hypothetical protein
MIFVNYLFLNKINVSAKHIKEVHLLLHHSFIQFIYRNSFILILLILYSILKTINMITNIMTILYILTVFDEIISGTLQKGTAISQIYTNTQII